MSSTHDHYDTLIIGAGIIGAATAFELAKLGYRTLNVDKLPAAGYGPTSSSCAIIRAPYSTVNGGARDIRPLDFSLVAIRPKIPARKNFITTMTRVANSSMCA